MSDARTAAIKRRERIYKRERPCVCGEDKFYSLSNRCTACSRKNGRDAPTADCCRLTNPETPGQREG